MAAAPCSHPLLASCALRGPRAPAAFASPRTLLRGGGLCSGSCFLSRRRPLSQDRARGARRVICCSQQGAVPLRRCCSVLESEFSSGINNLDSTDWQAVPDIWKIASERYGDRVAVVDPYHDPPSELTYKQLEQEILYFSEGLRAAGANPNEKIALFADNSCRWLTADQGIMAIGAIDVVRGTKSSVEELLHIYNHSDSTALVVDNPEFFNRLGDEFSMRASARFIVLLWGDKSLLNGKIPYDTQIFSYDEVIVMGQDGRRSLLSNSEKGQRMNETIGPEDVATIIYTSGTTGSPKGVMLTHGNLLHQIKNLWEIVPAEAGDKFLSVLPPWHVYERAGEYFSFTRGIQQTYTNVKNLKVDLRRCHPHFFISVPLIYETLYSGIQKQISTSSAARKFIALNLIRISLLYMEMKRIHEGKVLTENRMQNSFLFDMFDWFWAKTISLLLWPLHSLAVKFLYKKIHSIVGIHKAGISGGGRLSLTIDKFFEAIGIQIQNGYGLTETSPVVAARRPSHNVLGTIGRPIQDTEIKIVNLETGHQLPDGSKGIIKVRGPQVMKGYYKNPSATVEALDEEGWFNTGDIGWIAPQHARGRSRHCGGLIVIEGRAKDTIVLSTGENVEPSELEEAALCSNLIEQIVVIGQDQRRLGAVIVPKKEEILMAAKKMSLVTNDSPELRTDIMLKLLRDELTTRTSGFSFQIGPILIVDEPFTIDSGLMTPTMKVRRDRVAARYSDQIADLYK